MNNLNGVINLYKPSGISSFKAVSIVRKRLNIRKVGHLGTLDPLAEGVLPIAVGKATKLFDISLERGKEYLAIFSFGTETDTFDLEGKVVTESNILPSLVNIKSSLSKFEGEIEQVPPKFSAVNVNGKRAYEMARKGEQFELSPKKVNIKKFTVIGKVDPKRYLFYINCGSGTYIRSLVRDLAYELNTVGHMTHLVRVSASGLMVSKSIKIDEVGTESITHIDKFLYNLPSVNLDKKYREKLINGNSIGPIKGLENYKKSCKFKLYSDNEFLGIGKFDKNDLIKLDKLLIKR